MQFIKDDAVCVKSVLVGNVRRKHLIVTPCWQVHNPLLRCKDLHALRQRRAHGDHVLGDFEHNRSLLPVGGASVHFGTLFIVAAG
ncbi:hypothetical protein SDC9_121362 [bioreactor metagenome]|uniref:Uncharacterized protein n=1 Tax=bioreactor metagenome TaxID=1076179 RepID=A0A645CBR8_9ZZZZ